MICYGTLGDYRFADAQEAALDIRGSKIYGLKDQKLGEIDDVIFDQTTGAIVFVVVDTGGWLSSKKFIVPPQEIRPSLQHEDDFLVDLNKEQIESFPPYDEKTLTTEEKWADYEERYRAKWVEKPVMHRQATDRNVTPSTKQRVGAGSGTIPTYPGDGAEADTAELDTAELEAAELDAATELAPVHDEANMEVSPSGPSLRWTAFEDTLRQRREEVLQSSIDNVKLEDAKRASGETRSESQRRKAS